MSLQIRPETEARTNTLAAGSGKSVDDYLAGLLDGQPIGEPAVESQSEPSRRPIREVIADNMKGVPQEDFSALPADSLDQIDHYVYGVPKKAS